MSDIDIVERLESHMGLADIQNVLADCREAATEIDRLRSLATQHRQGGEVNVDALAQEIRRVDGNHSLGAGAFAEALLPFLTAALAQQPLSAQEGWKPIETAKRKSGERILIAFEKSQVAEGYWGLGRYNRSTKEYERGWVLNPNSGLINATHWQPLPAAPFVGGEQE